MDRLGACHLIVSPISKARDIAGKRVRLCFDASFTVDAVLIGGGGECDAVKGCGRRGHLVLVVVAEGRDGSGQKIGLRFSPGLAVDAETIRRRRQSHACSIFGLRVYKLVVGVVVGEGGDILRQLVSLRSDARPSV